jgi:hypothetical protein
MLGLHLFLAHAVADYSFSNPMKMYGMKSPASIAKHSLWFVLVFLAFTFDTVFASGFGIVVFFCCLALHFFIDFLRISKRNVWLVECASWGAFLIIGLLSSSFFSNSYITPAFAMYLTGMVVVSVIPTQIFRMLNWINPMDNESEGISERLAIFIFLVAQNWLLVGISVACALVYRIIFKKRFDRVWWISPLLAIGIALIFRWIIY